MKSKLRLVVLVVLAVVAAGDALAQQTATIVGRVRDATGAVVPAARVSVKNTDTGFTRASVTTDTGDFELPLLPIVGAWTLSIAKEGFQTHEASGIVLQVDQRARFDVTLKVGSTSETVNVIEETPIVHTETGAIGQVITNKSVINLPLNGRSFLDLATLLPNAITTTSGFGSPMVTVSGGRSSKTEFLLDGVSINEQLFDGAAVVPSVAAIQEFKVQANSFSAEYGRGNAIINATIQGGTNEFHGSVYEFLRNDKLDANSFFLNTAGARKAPYRQNQFGAAVGGPVVKDRSFFFLNYEGTRIRRGLTFNPVVPNAAFRRGDFSGVATIVRDPLTGNPFQGNQIPANRINASTAFFHQFIPEPNTAAGSFAYGASFQDTRNQGNARYDHRLGENDNLFVRYTVVHRDAFNPGQYPQNGGFSNRNRNQNLVLNEAHIFSPTLINELRLGYTRWHNGNFNQGLGTNYTNQSGIRGFEETSLNFPGFPQLSITGFNGVAGNAFQPIINPTNLYEIVDNLSIIRGAHTIRVGADLRKYDLSSTNSANSRGNFSFTPAYTGLAYADFLTGFPTSGARAFPRNHFGLYETRYHFYIQDDWKVSNNLTLNLGLRYELNIQPTGKQGQTAKFDFDTGRWIVSTFNGQINLVTQQVAKFSYPRFQSLIDSPPERFGLPNKLLFNDYNDWAPRIGIAWRPFGNNKTVVRAGGGVFYLLQSGNNIVSAPIINVPFIVDESKQQAVVGGRPTLQVQNFFEPFSSNASFATPLTYGVNPHFPTPLLYQWNFALQREVVRDLSLEVAYVANKGTHLERALPQNLPRISSTDLRPFQDRRPRPQFGTGSFYDNRDNSNYNALEAKLEKRYSKGYSFLIGYLYGKSIDGNTNDQGGEGADNPFDLRSMRGRSLLDVGQRFVASFGVELPFGKGKRWGASAPAVADKVIGGWQVSGIVTFQGGFPFTPVIASDPANVAFTYARRPDVAGTGRVDECRPEQCFNINDFRVPARFTIGNAGRNILRGPGVNNWNLAFLKDTYVTEKVYVQFRAEFFNFFNHTQFNNPNNNIELPAVGGRVFSAKDPRIGQFGLKVNF